MREFILYSGKGRTSPDFSLKDMTGSGGRMDLNARCVISALWLSQDIRRDSRIIISLNGPPDPPLAISFSGGELKRVSPDERNIGIWLRKTLGERGLLKEDEWLETSDGIKMARKSFRELLEEQRGRNLYMLREDGEDIRKAEMGKDPVFLLGDHIGLPEEVAETALESGAKKIGLGRKSYFSSQSITLVHNELDRRSKDE